MTSKSCFRDISIYGNEPIDPGRASLEMESRPLPCHDSHWYHLAKSPSETYAAKMRVLRSLSLSTKRGTKPHQSFFWHDTDYTIQTLKVQRASPSCRVDWIQYLSVCMSFYPSRAGGRSLFGTLFKDLF